MSFDYPKLEEHKHFRPSEVKIVNGQPTLFQDVIVHTICLSDVDDPDLYIAEPIWKWQQTEEGKFIMDNAIDRPYWVSNFNSVFYGYTYKIVARLQEKDLVFWRLKWGGLKS